MECPDNLPSMRRAYYSDSIAGFLAATTDTMIGRLARASEFPVEQSQRLAWERQIEVLRPVVEKYEGPSILSIRFLAWVSALMWFC